MRVVAGRPADPWRVSGPLQGGDHGLLGRQTSSIAAVTGRPGEHVTWQDKGSGDRSTGFVPERAQPAGSTSRASMATGRPDDELPALHAPARRTRQGRRRGPGEGSVFQRRDGRWCGVATVGCGERRYFYGKTRVEVAAKLTAALVAVEAGRPLPRDRETVGSYLDRWLEGIPGTVRSTTLADYRFTLHAYFPPELRRLRLAQLRADHVQAAYSRLRGSGRSPATVRRLHVVLHRALSQAERWGLIVRNPAALVDTPRSPHFQFQVLSANEARRLLKEAAGDPLEALYVLAITTGMRRGELLALHWADVDLERGVLAVTGTLQRVDGRLVVAEPKTARSRRSVTLEVHAIQALRAHACSQAAARLAAGESWQEQDLVFPNRVGLPFEPRNLLQRSYKPLLRRANLPDIRFHDLRHTAATLLLSQNVHPKVVADLLGHASVAMTLDLYSHAVEGLSRSAATAIDSLLWG